MLEAGARHGLAGKLHANELGSTGGAALAAELGCVSADHLRVCDDQEKELALLRCQLLESILDRAVHLRTQQLIVW